MKKSLYNFNPNDTEEIQEKKDTKEKINHPSHYQSGNGIEVIDIIESFGCGFHLGNVVKYVLRAGKKSNGYTESEKARLEDLKKAMWYLKREIDNIEKMN